MSIAYQTFIINLTPQMTRYKQRVDGLIMPSLNCRNLHFSHQLRREGGELFKRKHIRYHPTVALQSGANMSFEKASLISIPAQTVTASPDFVMADAQISSAPFEEFSVTSTNINDVGELKIRIEVSGTRTQRIFDDVFEKMVAAAQPIPGFRRVKGGKTPNIPKNILLEVLGPSKVFKEVIKKIINSTVAEYVEKEQLKVGKDLRVEQSFEDLETAFDQSFGDLETTFEAGEKFSFDAIVQLKEHS